MSEQLRELFYKKLCLQYLSQETQDYFFDVMEEYIKHGRTYEYISSTLERLCSFLEQ